MGRFMEKNLPLTSLCRTKDDVARLVQARSYDSLVCGSDQVWMKDDYVGFDATYYLDVVGSTATRRISYAPSCGSMSSYGEHAEVVKRLLSRFNAISVRDRHTMQLLASLGITGTTLVIDPTLLADFTPLLQRRRIPSDYLAVVGPTDDAACKFIRSIADRLGLPIVALGTRCRVADHQKRFVHAGEWVTYLSAASFVVTSLFHGAALAIRFRKPFVALDTGGRGFKLVEFLARFGLEERFRRPAGYTVEAQLLTMQYDSCEREIAAAIAGSVDYLNSALHDRS